MGVRVLPLGAHVMVPQIPPAHRVVAASPVPARPGSSRSHASCTVRDRVRVRVRLRLRLRLRIIRPRLHGV